MLRTLFGIIGYQIEALDGIKGKVHDFLFDDLTWTVRYVVAEIGALLGRRRVLISPTMLGQPEWSQQILPCCLTIRQIENSAADNTDRPAPRQHLAREPAPGDSHLRSLQQVIGYRLRARDGAIGHVYDIVIDDERWSIQSLAIATGNWRPGRKVLVSPDWIESISCEAGEVKVSVWQDDIEGSPEYEPAAPVNCEYEPRLYDYSGRPTGWD